jgi:hypothetical protein
MTARAWAKAAPDKNSTAAANNSARMTLPGVKPPPLPMKLHVPRRRACSGIGSRTHNATSQVSPPKFPFELSPEFTSSSSESFSASLHLFRMSSMHYCLGVIQTSSAVPYRQVKPFLFKRLREDIPALYCLQKLTARCTFAAEPGRALAARESSRPNCF